MRRTALALVFASLAAAGCEPVPPTSVEIGNRPPGALIAFYDEVAFGVDASGQPTSPIARRWLDDASIRVLLSNGTASDRATLETIFSELSALTGLSFHWDGSGSDSIAITFAPHEEWENFVESDRQYGGMTYRDHGPHQENFRITAARIYILPHISGAARDYLLLHELTHAIGFGHTDTYEYSAMSVTGGSNTSLSEEDRFAIRSHYDSRVDPGMSLQEVHGALGWD